MSIIEIQETEEGWAVFVDDAQIEVFPPDDAGYLSAQVLRDILGPVPVVVYNPEPKEPAKTRKQLRSERDRARTLQQQGRELAPEPEPEPEPEPTAVELDPEPAPIPTPEPAKDPFPFPPGIRCFWWPKTEISSLCGSFDGIYKPPIDGAKVVIRKGETHGYLVACTRALTHALRESGVQLGDIITIRSRGVGYLKVDDRGPAQLFSIEITKKRQDREDPYEPGKN